MLTMGNFYNLQPLSQGLWGILPTLKAYLIDLRCILNKMAISKLSFDAFREKMVLRERSVVLRSLLTLKKGTRTFNSNQISALWSFKTIPSIWSDMGKIAMIGPIEALWSFIIGNAIVFHLVKVIEFPIGEKVTKVFSLQ